MPLPCLCSLPPQNAHWKYQRKSEFEEVFKRHLVKGQDWAELAQGPRLLGEPGL
jgi:hypothetical protein